MCIRGSNGSGKSTLLHLIAGLSHPSSGKIEITLNRKTIKPSPRIGFCQDNPLIYRNVSVSVFLNFISTLLRVEHKESLLLDYYENFNLIKWINKPIGMLSKGMLHKVALIASMIDNPQLLVLDEPFSSLDEFSAKFLIKKLQQLSSEGSSIIFADPSNDQSKNITDNIINLDKPKVIS